MWPVIPEDVIDYVRMVFSHASDETTERLSNQPNIRETSLDDALVTAVAKYSTPRLLASNTVVTIQVHNIGGTRQWNRWELADIALLVHVYSSRQSTAQKIGLLQSKRLYPENHDVDVDDPVAFLYGLNHLLDPPESIAPQFRRTTYKFNNQSIYGVINHDDEQLRRIVEFQKKFGESVFYLLYHPSEIPFECTLPADGYQSVECPQLGPRVVRSGAIESALDDPFRPNKSPTFEEIKSSSGNDYWRLETWAADLLLRCKVGRQYSESDHNQIDSLVRRRSGPISAAIRINITLSDQSEVY